MKPENDITTNGFSENRGFDHIETSTPDSSLFKSQISTDELDAGFGTSATRSGTNAVSQIFSEGGFERRSKGWILVVGGCCLLLVALVMISIEDEYLGTNAALPPGSLLAVDSPSENEDPDLAMNNVEKIDQQALRLECEEMETADDELLVRYGCNAVLKSGDYHGTVLGWWKAVNSAGDRLPLFELEFREAGYDATFQVAARNEQGQIRVIAWDKDD